MKKRTIYLILALLVCISCTNQQEISLSDEKIQVTVSNALQSDSRTTLFNNKADIEKAQDFALSAYIGNALYIDNAQVHYFNNEWRFQYGNDLLDYYWPNDGNVLDFIAYVPYDLTKFAATDISIKNDGRKMNLVCSLPAVIDVSDETKLQAAESQCEFIYAYRKGQAKSDTPVDLCFVHPFACVQFKLKQGHRDLKIHHIILTGIKLSGTYANDTDTQTYDELQSGLTYAKWNTEAVDPHTLTIYIEKNVPNGVNYGGVIGVPFMVIPQALTKLKLKVNYSWSDKDKQDTDEFSLSIGSITSWEPGRIYTYTLDLGDNQAEILFNVSVEEWAKGETDNYENGYEVK